MNTAILPFVVLGAAGFIGGLGFLALYFWTGGRMAETDPLYRPLTVLGWILLVAMTLAVGFMIYHIQSDNLTSNRPDRLIETAGGAASSGGYRAAVSVRRSSQFDK